MDSFISWVGGKKLLRQKILNEFPGQGTFGRYIEVFGGSWMGTFCIRKARKNGSV